jgi:flagellar assembly protein FliH
MATPLKKYMFDLDFDALPNELPPEPAAVVPIEGEEGQMAEAPPPPTFSEFEMDEAKRIAWDEGHTAGVAEAAEVTERRQAEALAALAAGFAGVLLAQKENMDGLRREAVQLALAIVKKLHPEMVRRHGVEEIGGAIHECLMQLDEPVRLTVRVHPDLLDNVRAEATRVAEEAEFEGKMQFVADAKLAPGDSRVEWGNGGADRDQALLWAEIETIVARAMSGTTAAPAAAPAR